MYTCRHNCFVASRLAIGRGAKSVKIAKSEKHCGRRGWSGPGAGLLCQAAPWAAAYLAQVMLKWHCFVFKQSDIASGQHGWPACKQETGSSLSRGERNVHFFHLGERNMHFFHPGERILGCLKIR